MVLRAVKTSNFKFLFAVVLAGSLILNGCSGSGEISEEKNEHADDTEYRDPVSELEMERKGNKILETAREEQKNEMYATANDSAFLYWINDPLFGNFSKCNVFAINVLYKAGCKCPYENVTTYDLMDTSRFTDILSIVRVNEGAKILKGDLIIWNGHVIIFESFTANPNDDYVIAWWGGSRQTSNGTEIMNDVAHGKYPLEEGYIVRRPMRIH